ncbi:unnamed protein product [Prorocentrum cordatum]|uniref:Uncharacterized protein n=1 Tax=Prorocentrum cordatum TaxID=2364126 RepID=A0ABN9TS11_9DINO|nr:unnamed protein product [Polarella glacialis]
MRTFAAGVENAKKRCSHAGLCVSFWQGLSGVVHRALAVLVVVLTLSVIVAAIASGGKGTVKECEDDVDHFVRMTHLGAAEAAEAHRGIFAVQVMAMAVTAPSAFSLLAFAATSHMCRVAEYATCLWLEVLTFAVYSMLQCNGLNGEPFAIISGFLLPVNMALFYLLLLRQVRALERSSFLDLGSLRLRRIMVTMLIFAMSAFICSRFAGGPPGHPSRIIMGTLVWAGDVSFMVALVVFLQAFWRVLAMARETQRRGASTEEIKSAPRVLIFQMVGSSMAVVSFCVALMVRMWASDLAWPILGRPVDERTPEFLIAVQSVSLVDTTLNAFAALALSGASFGALSGGLSTIRSARQRHRTWKQFSAEWSPHPDTNWNAKVEELAGRGFTLQALLEFYCRLGKDVMPYFDPSKHTTEDVVRGAIIPLSADSKTSMAEVMMGHSPVRPDKMVTHNWGNIFTDLVAAIVSDALSESEYCKVAVLLIHDINTLMRWVAQSNVGSQTYWVCALSVNQHTSICATNLCSRRDSVTGEPYPLCSCGLPKTFNATPPLASDGTRSQTRSEMNKFDQLMMSLSAGNDKFAQVVAVDRRFDIFNRAWCMAEIAAAHSTGMSQSLRLPSLPHLEKRQGGLARLSISSAQASMPQEKEAILGSIPDHKAFDRRLRELLIGQLLPSWSRLDSCDQMLQAGRIARWQSVVHKCPAVAWRFGVDSEECLCDGSAHRHHHLRHSRPDNHIGLKKKSAPAAGFVV